MLLAQSRIQSQVKRAIEFIIHKDRAPQSRKDMDLEDIISKLVAKVIKDHPLYREKKYQELLQVLCDLSGQKQKQVVVKSPIKPQTKPVTHERAVDMFGYLGYEKLQVFVMPQLLDHLKTQLAAI